MFVYDFDHPEEWIWRFEKMIAPMADAIHREIQEKTEWELAGSHIRISTPKPADPSTTEALAAIRSDFGDKAFRAFHATRLLNSESVLKGGLLALNRKRQISRVLDAVSGLTSSQSQERIAAWENWTEDTDEVQSCQREKSCWLTPSRRALHDGGLDPMFERFGGEFIERISGDPFDGKRSCSSEIGRPMVVVAAIPTKWCRRTYDMGPQRVLHEVLGGLGYSLNISFIEFWDVQVEHDIPPDRIEYVCPRDDLRVADPTEGAR